MQHMAELFLLRAQIVQVVRVGLDLERDAFDDLDAVAADAGSLARVVRQDPDLRDAEIRQDLGTDPVVTEIRPEAQAVVGLDGVETFPILQLIGLDLVLESGCSGFDRRDNAAPMPAGSVISTTSLDAPGT